MGKKRKKQPTTKVPRTRGSGKYTESQFWGMIRATLRNKSRFWAPINNTRKRVRVPYVGTNKRKRWEYVCERCGGKFDATKIVVHHIYPVGRLACAEDLPEFVEKLFCEEKDLMAICEKCHEEIHK